LDVIFGGVVPSVSPPFFQQPLDAEKHAQHQELLSIEPKVFRFDNMVDSGDGI
jgi:hypothetical protein